MHYMCTKAHVTIMSKTKSYHVHLYNVYFPRTFLYEFSGACIYFNLVFKFDIFVWIEMGELYLFYVAEINMYWYSRSHF